MLKANQERDMFFQYESELIDFSLFEEYNEMKSNEKQNFSTKF